MKWAALLLVCASVAIAGCGGEEGPVSKRGKKGAVVERKPVPDAYKDRKAPEGMNLSDEKVIAEGKRHFLDTLGPNCASCHGKVGKGDGALAPTLNPKPQDLTDPAFHDAVTDQYIFWRIQKPLDGAPAGGSAMTGFDKGTDEQIWQVIAYVRSLKGK